MSFVEVRLVTESHDFISAGIRDITWSQYSHIEFVLDPEWDAGLKEIASSSQGLRESLHRLQGNLYNNLTIGARHSDGVQVRSDSYTPYSLDDRFLVEVTPDQKRELVRFVAKQIGKPYDTTAIFGVLAHRDWRTPNSWYCSELVTAAFEAAGAPILYVPQHVNRITPRDTSLSIKLIPKRG
jgi:hypothetical protein